MAQPTVRDAVLDVFRERGLTKLFANPGSTEVPFLAGLPADFEFVLGLHEAPLVAMASGFAIGRGEPALVILHTTAGLGTAVGALATARVNRAPLVVLVGQQDRRHLAHEPFLAGRLAGLAGEYPVWTDQPVRPQDVPGAISRAWHEATTGRGPAIVIVPMDDWSAPAPDASDPPAAPSRLVRATTADPAAAEELAGILADARSPTIVVGAGADEPETWDALVELAEKLNAPVWQESFGGRAGFPQDHPLFAGHLPAERDRLRARLQPYDVVLVVGGAAFRQYSYVPGPHVAPGTRVLVVTDDPAEAHRSAAELAVLAPLAPLCVQLALRLPRREPAARETPADPPLAGSAHQNPLHAGDVFDELVERLPHDAILVEESPSSRPELHAKVPVRTPLGFVSAAMGGLGFGMAAAIGLKMARPDRPVLSVVGDGSSLYAVHALWTAAHCRVGALSIVLSNGGYAVMDRLAERYGDTAPWPSFEVDVAGLARAFGCPARRVKNRSELVSAFDEVIPTLAERSEPLLLEILVAPDETFEP
jgi:benzoylformate decarboxylase